MTEAEKGRLRQRRVRGVEVTEIEVFFFLIRYLFKNQSLNADISPLSLSVTHTQFKYFADFMYDDSDDTLSACNITSLLDLEAEVLLCSFALSFGVLSLIVSCLKWKRVLFLFSLSLFLSPSLFLPHIFSLSLSYFLSLSLSGLNTHSHSVLGALNRVNSLTQNYD